MIVPRFECPICYKSFSSNPKTCPFCGFEGIEQYIAESQDKNANINFLRNELFNIYKYTKAVYHGKIPFENDTVETDSDENEGLTHIMSVISNRGLSIVNLHNENMPVVAEDGILAFEHTKSLIINVDIIKNNVLDESQIRILFLGPDVKKIEGDYLQRAYLKYIFVDSSNKHYSSENNVLFNKSKTKLILYPSLKNEEEYRVPETVKEYSPKAFRMLENLKTLYIPKSSHFTSSSIGNASHPDFKIIYY